MSLKPSTVSFRSLQIGDSFVFMVNAHIYKKETPTSYSDETGKEHHFPTHMIERQVFEIYYGEDE
jgi:hypothetical protein